MTLDFPIRCCWMKRAQQMALPAAGKSRDYLHWIGAYNWLQDTIEALCVPRKTSPNFIRFLEYLLVQRVPDRPVVLVLDNASYHHAADVQACLSLFQDRVMVVWLPPYSPDLNPIEMAFSKLKALLRKRAARSFDTICDALKDICHLFEPIQCRNFFKATGYEAN